jgi:hypothetical protein
MTIFSLMRDAMGEYENTFRPSLATAISGLERRPGLWTWCPPSQMRCKTRDAREHPRGLPAAG